jgi:hypothetical protein
MHCVFYHFARRVRRVKSVLLLSWIPFVRVGGTKSFLAAKKRSPPNEIISFQNGFYALHRPGANTHSRLSFECDMQLQITSFSLFGLGA